MEPVGSVSGIGSSFVVVVVVVTVVSEAEVVPVGTTASIVDKPG